MRPLTLSWVLRAVLTGVALGALSSTPVLAEDDAAALARQAESQLDPETQARLAEADAGAKSIDVSSYPAAVQERYAVFAASCKKCHTLARPINSDYALPSEWSRYVKRMMRKPGSGITKSKARTIYEFLAYDSLQRKADLVTEKLAALSVEDRAIDEAKMAELRALLEEAGS